MGGLARRLGKPQTKPYQRIRENQKRMGQKIAVIFKKSQISFCAKFDFSKTNPNKNLTQNNRLIRIFL